MRLARSTLWAASLIPFASADVKFTSITGGDALIVGYGPSPITVEWTDSGNEPKIAQLESYVLDLCAGTNDNFASVKTITSKGLFSLGNIAKGIILPTDGGDAESAYFFRIVSKTKDGETITNYSPRFTLSGMAGKFPASVQEALDAEPILDTDAPVIEDANDTELKKRQGGAPIGAGAAATATAVAAGGSYTIPYTMQTGLTKYAPMQRVPSSKITKSSASMQFPTSNYTPYTTYASIPTQVMTVTQSGTFTISSREATQHCINLNHAPRFFSTTTALPSNQHQQQQQQPPRGADLIRRRQLLTRVQEYRAAKKLQESVPAAAMSINKPDVREALKGKYPAKTHARKVKEWIVANGGDAGGVVYLEGQKTRMNEDNDQEMPFRQRRYFFYLTGCDLPDCYLAFDMKTEKSTLFIPPIDPDEVIWSGLPLSPEEALQKYEIDDCKPSTEVNAYLSSANNSKATVYAINGQISDETTFLSFENKNFELLKTAVEECRAIKTSYEIALITHANNVSTAAHTAVMAAAKSATNERELEAIFLKNCIERGCRNQAYSSILASGTSAATLHYVRNDQPLAGKLNLLVDAGAEKDCYASDITRTFPISGKFSPESRAIYDIVLRMQKEAIDSLKAGVNWDEVHSQAHRTAIAGLLDLGILKGDAKAIFDSRTSVAFFPHGLGHYLGMDTHDCGGHPNYADKDPMFRYLRKRGTLPAGSVITVEPGIYFCRFIIEPYLKDEKHKGFIDEKVLEKYWEVGGVRIEDNILVTENGYQNLTETPKETVDVEAIVAG
ncbi:putative xaa-pro dipeptidase protein [Neofusicoccum parvum UCRNP2]|uniref:Xaa-Pro aminopeptidase n=1 Tax=Botryosphaeria parva (strain UCR-NP2) TaxID=1287680 RepID=R1EB48_BOTPV|nr:putative xaa-pro dipeptidase protein [Neofusicoccum parvum UCRNP2]